MKGFTAIEIMDAYNKIFRMKLSEAKELLKDDNCTLLEITLIKLILKGRGDILLDRILGKMYYKNNMDIIDAER